MVIGGGELSQHPVYMLQHLRRSLGVVAADDELDRLDLLVSGVEPGLAQ